MRTSSDSNVISVQGMIGQGGTGCLYITSSNNGEAGHVLMGKLFAHFHMILLAII